MIRILFVCLGNICRSTMAEAVMRHKIKLAGLEDQIQVDSAGTSNYHIGEPPHSGTRKKLAQQGISDAGIYGRQITKEDIPRFDYVIGMDESNLRDIKVLARKEDRGNLYLLSDFVENCGWKSVPDPWYTDNFDETFDLVSEGCDALLKRITAVIKDRPFIAEIKCRQEKPTGNPSAFETAPIPFGQRS